MTFRFRRSTAAALAVLALATVPLAGCSDNSPTPDDSGIEKETDGAETPSNDTSQQQEPDCPETDDGCTDEIRRECNDSVLLVCERNDAGCIEGRFIDCSEEIDGGTCRDGECVDG